MNGSEVAALARASDQYGVITREQMRRLGLSDGAVDQRLRAGRLLVCYPGVYRVPGAPETNRQRAMAACLWLGDGAAVSHVTAGALLRLDGIRRPPLHVVSTTNRVAPFTLHRVTKLDRIDRVTVDGIPYTSATRTLIDVASALDDEALESPLEVKTWRLVRRSELPRPDRQVPILDYRVDLLWRAQRVVLECDGFEAHAGYLRWKRDRRRVSAIEAAGYRMLHVTWDDVTSRPDEVVRRCLSALGRG